MNSINQKQDKLFDRLKKDIPLSIEIAIKEDLNYFNDIKKDITAQLLPKKSKSNAFIITREDGIFCGKYWVEEIFNQLGGDIKINWMVEDGDFFKKNQYLCHLIGSTEKLLTGERLVLNFLQTLCGISTKVKQYVKALEGTKTILLDTRKTLPGLRTAQKYAVLCGGGCNHRLGLSNFFLIKENHIQSIGSISKAVKKAITLRPDLPIEVEVENLEEVNEALSVGVDIILLDNFNREDIINAVKFINNRAKIELSGNMTLQTIKNFALTGIFIGIDYISVGSITKNINSIDLSLRIHK